MQLALDKDKLGFGYSTQIPDNLNFLFGKPCKDYKKLKYSFFDVLLLEVDEDGLDMPETKHQCEVTMELCELSRICTAMEGLGDFVTVIV